jgi:hypothetical protein
VRAYKFLRAGRVAPFSGYVWPVHDWVEAEGALDECRAGVHACRVDQLAYWTMPELWQVELDGELDDGDLKLVARRGRLGDRVTAWDDDVKQAYADEGVRRTARYATMELDEVGMSAEADRLRSPDITVLAVAAGSVEQAALARNERDAATLAGLVGDAAGYAAAGHVTGPAFIAAHAADVHGPVNVDDPFAAERRDQSRWLAARLHLPADG